MNAVTRLFRLLPLSFPRRHADADRPARAGAGTARRRAGRAVAWFAVVFLALNVFAVLALDSIWPRFRDPEYGLRLNHLRERIAEHPGRPLVAVIGSSRVSMGLSPAAWEEVRPRAADRPDPLIFNMSLVGSGPVMELMCLRRLYADGVRPAAVVVEYWPPFLREDGAFYEPNRIDHTRLFPCDRPLVRDYFARAGDADGKTRADEVEAKMRTDRLNPFYETRHRLVAQMAPRWQPWHRRFDATWSGLDAWGWLPGIDEYPPVPENRKGRLAHCEPIYRKQFEGYTIHDLAKRAIHETVALARANGSKVAFTYLPESSEFRSWMPPDVERAGRDYLDQLGRELAVPVIDARHWLPDDYLVDGFHLSRQGAAEFTRRFGPAVASTFPDLGRRE